jgi:hypothetical protein
VGDKEGCSLSQYFKEKEETEIVLEGPFKEVGLWTWVDLTGWTELMNMKSERLSNLIRCKIGKSWWQWNRPSPKDRTQTERMILSALNLDERTWRMGWATAQKKNLAQVCRESLFVEEQFTGVGPLAIQSNCFLQ